MPEYEAIIWCPKCKTDHFRLERVPADKPGVFAHRLVTIDANVSADKSRCGTCNMILERKPEERA